MIFIKCDIFNMNIPLYNLLIIRFIIELISIKFINLIIQGTGIYGPTRKTIVPVNKNVLSWVDTSGTRHFAKSVKGIKPMPILEDTFKDNKELIIKAIEKYWEG